MCTLLAGGGVFWAAGEPIAHFLATPPVFGDAPADCWPVPTWPWPKAFSHWGLSCLGNPWLADQRHADAFL
ncbi:hypothetical protein DPM13_15390 [Paracoccus mutanolyticus]|uniref:Uncharacterized protein n=1 Tax=Paracoccus mutanolyticus TaxID=1499308 RepID=A0ABN5MAN0_9RHOB|nr:hypothetical protein DPM13_15390 [Paracoccus mutanolyticus]